MNKIVNGVANDYEFDIPPISAYDCVDLNELLKVMERFKKIPTFDDLMKDNNKKDKKIERLQNIIDEYIEDMEDYLETDPLIYVGDYYIHVTNVKQQEKDIKDLSFFRTLQEKLDYLKELKEGNKDE